MSHSAVVKAARMFTAAGFPVFRFDFSGCGDSEGDLHFTSLKDWQQDLDAAVKVFCEETGVSQCLLWGLRLGAGLALLRQQCDSDIAGLILWQPVLHFSAHIKQFLRREISAHISQGNKRPGLSPEDKLQRDGLVHIIGYPITKDFYEGFNRLGNRPVNVIPTVPVFMLSVSLTEQPSIVLKQYAEFLQEAGTPVILQHVTAEPFWDRYWQWECNKSAEATLQWLQGLM